MFAAVRKLMWAAKYKAPAFLAGAERDEVITNLSFLAGISGNVISLLITNSCSFSDLEASPAHPGLPA